MRFLMYYIGCFIVFCHISYASNSQSSLPPLPTLDMPGRSKAVDIIPKHENIQEQGAQNLTTQPQDEKNISQTSQDEDPNQKQAQIQNKSPDSSIVQDPTIDRDNKASTDSESQQKVDSNTKTIQDNSQNGFMDTGGHVLPKVSSPNSSERGLLLPVAPGLDSDISDGHIPVTSESSNNPANSSVPAVPISQNPDAVTENTQANDSGNSLDLNDLPPMKEEINNPTIPANNPTPEHGSDASLLNPGASIPNIPSNNDTTNNLPTSGPVITPPANPNDMAIEGAPNSASDGQNDISSTAGIASDNKSNSSSSDSPSPSTGASSNPYVESSSPPVRKRRGGIEEVQMSDEQIRQQERETFIKNESIMLLVEDDDIVLGRLTKKAYLEQMPCKEYINLSEKTYVSHMDQKNRNTMDSFIRKYEFSHDGVSSAVLSNKEAQDLAFDAVYSSNIDDVRVLINNYSILQNSDEDQNNMLMLAIELGDIPMSKFLIRRGSNLYKTNYYGDSPISLAKRSRDLEVQKLINDAIFFGRVK